jgi:beta-glucosidase
VELTQHDFPDLIHLAPDFVWGVATSSFQIEGASSDHQRGQSIWDAFCRRPGAILDASDGLRACEHVDRLEQDLDLIASLGVSAYRFSIAWPRVQPNGDGMINGKGLDFYQRLVDGLLQRGIEPYPTLYHWDLPLSLQHRYGGWYGRETVARFADYADVIARHLGDRVPTITTINEPWVIAMLGHEHGVFAPGLKSRELALQVAHNLLVAHGLAAQAIRARCPAKVGIVLNMSPIHPLTDAPADIAKARLDDGQINRWYMDALLKGHYPADVLEHFGSDAPVVLGDDFKVITQPLDFIGVNYYTRNFASTGDPWSATKTGAAVTDMGWEIYPAGLTELLVRLNRDWVCPPIFVTENGAAFPDKLVDGAVIDRERVEYLATHIAAVDEAARQGVPMAGYFVWSLMDNFEWSSGYLRRFGIVYTDYETLERTPKASAHWYAKLLARQRKGVARPTTDNNTH